MLPFIDILRWTFLFLFISLLHPLSFPLAFRSLFLMSPPRPSAPWPSRRLDLRRPTCGAAADSFADSLPAALRSLLSSLSRVEGGVGRVEAAFEADCRRGQASAHLGVRPRCGHLRLGRRSRFSCD